MLHGITRMTQAPFLQLGVCRIQPPSANGPPPETDGSSDVSGGGGGSGADSLRLRKLHKPVRSRSASERTAGLYMYV